MCGISGWVDFERDLREERATGQAMAATLARRGPDGHGGWTSRHALLAHHRLSVIDLEGGAQPMAAGELAVMTYSGEVYNYRELRAELEGRGHVFRTAGDTEVVLHAYLQWGENFVDRLNGMYALAIWDRRTEELLLVRDRMGVKPLFFHRSAHGVLFGSEPKAILANPLVSPVLGLDELRELLAFVKNPGATVYRGMREVRPGHLVRVRRGGLVERRYWRLEAVEHTDDLDTTVATIRALLDDIVRRQLVSDVPLCSLLSGGLDSSVITALAAGARSEPVRTFAVEFAGHAGDFRPDVIHDAPDLPFVHEFLERVACDHTDVQVSTSDLLEPGNRAAVWRANDAPSALGDAYVSLYLLFKQAREHSTVALSGEAADEVFGGYPWFHDRNLSHSDTFPWLAQSGLFADRPALLAPDVLADLDLAAYRADSYRDARSQVPHLDSADPHERRMREVCHFHLTRLVQVLLDRKDRMSMASGLEVRVPFCDHRLVAYVFNTPWSMKSFDGREKSLLRAAAADLVPHSILQRRKSGYPLTQDPAYDRMLRRELAALLADDTAPALPLVDAGQAKLLLDRPVANDTPMATRFEIERLLGLNALLDGYGADLRVN